MLAFYLSLKKSFKMQQLQSKVYLKEEARAWLTRNNGTSEVIRVVPSIGPSMQQCYELYVAYEPNGESLGRILFDDNLYWIYDGGYLSVQEQEQVASFIVNYVERI